MSIPEEMIQGVMETASWGHHGDFMALLAKAWFAADSTNRRRIETTFEREFLEIFFQIKNGDVRRHIQKELIRERANDCL